MDEPRRLSASEALSAEIGAVAAVSTLQHRIQERKATEAQIALKRHLKEAQTGVGVERAFFCLTREHPIRRFCIRVTSSKYLDRFIIAAIVTNSFILGLSDFSVVDMELNPASNGIRFEDGVLKNAFSIRNFILAQSEIPFTSIFTMECIIKIIALGFILGDRSYLQDAWNTLDFVVVLSSLVAVLPGMPNVSAIRTIRVLRPLRSLSVIPGMRRLTKALLDALPPLANVLILQLFVFAIFGVLGIQLFGGNMNRRCRRSEFPLRLPADNSTGLGMWPVPTEYLDQVLANQTAFRCTDAPLLEDGDESIGKYTMETSPWRHPHDCFWPLDETDLSLCSMPGLSGDHKCSSKTWCGSNYDTFGNARFQNKYVMQSSLYRVELDWGYISFDHMGHAFFTIFQSITQDGWTTIMYMLMDSNDATTSAIFFVILIVFASFFVMNLTLAVISESFNMEEEPTTKQEKKQILQQSADVACSPKRPILFRIVSHPWFGITIMVVILANTCVLALDHYPMPSSLDSDLEMINFGLSCIFLVELVMKVAGLGLRQYARDRFNLFDALIVTTSVLETIATPPSFMSSSSQMIKKGAVSALRSFRLFRVFKLARNWRTLREMLAMVVRAVASIANFGVLLSLFIYIYALIGLQFFANTMRYGDDNYPITNRTTTFWEGTVPRNNFDTLMWSLVTVFQVISGENWSNIMYDTMRANGALGLIYFLSLVIVGSFVLMKLFLALLLDNFNGNDDETDAKEKLDHMKDLNRRMSTMKVLPVGVYQGALTNIPEERWNESRLASTNAIGPNAEEEEEEVNQIDLDHLTRDLNRELAAPKRKSTAKASTGIDELIAGTPPGKSMNPTIPNGNGEKASNEEQAQGKADPFVILPPAGRSLGLFSETNRVRRWAFLVISHRYFDAAVLLFILLSSISLAADNPLRDPEAWLPRQLKKLDDVFAYIFIVEMCLKIFALGLVFTKESYLRNGWNVLDCLIVASSVVMMIAESSKNASSFKSLRSLRGFRTFRPLRMISRRPGLKLVVNALFEAIPAVLNVLFLCMLFFLIFSIVAVNYLKGTMYSCSGDAFDALTSEQLKILQYPLDWGNLTDVQQGWFAVNATCTGFAGVTKLTSRYLCECWGGEWTRVMPEHFDNVGNAMLTFFEISTTEGWADVMMAAIDSNGIDMQPIRDNNMVWAGFFVMFILVGSFFVVNLFVGVIIDNFNRMKEALGSDFMLTEEQKKWRAAQETASRVGPVRQTKRPKQRWRARIFDFVRSNWFEYAILSCIMLNTLLMAVQFYGQPTIMQEIINDVNEVFAAVFTTEAVLKIIAYKRKYFEEAWNRFDFFVVLGTLGSIFVEMFTGASVRSLAMIVRVFRVTRIMRLVRASKNVRQILLTLYVSLPGLSNISSILFLMLFIYTTMGVQLFAKVALTENITAHANFQDFGTGFLLLLRAATGEAWNYIMHDFAKADTTKCKYDPPYNPDMCGFNNKEGCIKLNGCGSPIAFLFFCSFTLLVTYVMLNLTIAVILEGFSASHAEEEPLFEPEVLDEFQKKWSDIDPNASGFISVRLIGVLITFLEAPLGRASALKDRRVFLAYMNDLRLPLYEGETMQFKDVLLAMTREMVKETVLSDPNMLNNLPQSSDDSPRRQAIDWLAHEYFAARRIQRNVKKWVATKRELEKRFMEEYKNKIKKPSGRPKKVRDARVYTIG